jgi:hypothetical protein
MVLGTGDSGKSTFIKNMMIAHLAKNPFLPSQITGFKNALRLNVVESLVVICKTFLKNKANADHALAVRLDRRSNDFLAFSRLIFSGRRQKIWSRQTTS